MKGRRWSVFIVSRWSKRPIFVRRFPRIVAFVMLMFLAMPLTSIIICVEIGLRDAIFVKN